MIELIIIICMLGIFVWIVWEVRARKHALREAILDQAWSEVLSDPNYMERRHFEERKRVEDDAHSHFPTSA